MVRACLGTRGPLWLVAGAVLGLTDVDALTLSMAREARSDASRFVAAQALTIGIVSNTVVKRVIAGAVGVDRFRWATMAGLAVMAGALGVAGRLLLG